MDSVHITDVYIPSFVLKSLTFPLYIATSFRWTHTFITSLFCVLLRHLLILSSTILLLVPNHSYLNKQGFFFWSSLFFSQYSLSKANICCVLARHARKMLSRLNIPLQPIFDDFLLFFASSRLFLHLQFIEQVSKELSWQLIKTSKLHLGWYLVPKLSNFRFWFYLALILLSLYLNAPIFLLNGLRSWVSRKLSLYLTRAVSGHILHADL